MATVPLVAWRVAVKWFPDNGTPEEGEREEANAASRTTGARSAGAGKDKERMGESSEGRRC